MGCRWLGVLAGAIVCASGAETGPPSYTRQIRPLLDRHCLSCHHPAIPSGGVNLATYDAVRAASGRIPPMIEGQPPKMPKVGMPLQPVEVDVFRRWVAAGAPNDSAGDETWWSLRPLVRPRSGNSIDDFIHARLANKGWTPAPEADRRTLIRRLTFDLHGLPPTPAEIDAFVKDPSPDAYQRLVDRLLASPRYGERWARHWLDVVHYGESHGYDKDKPRRNAWPYRDWVIRALNDDKPYSRFVQEQLAGDVLFQEDPQAVAATGFIAAGPWDFVGHAELREGTVDKAITRLLDRDDMVATAMSTFVSLTVHCARCHDHKFDPIPQADYYSLQAVFAGVDRADRPYDEDPQIYRRRRPLLERQRLILSALQVPPAPDAHALLLYELAEADRGLARLPQPKLVYAAANFFDRYGTFHVPWTPRPVHVLARGSVDAPLVEAAPGALSAVTAVPARFSLPPSHTEGDRRAALARWVTHPDNPLTWRSIVNRLWHYHFGTGLVDTPNDFGRMGSHPSHPDLLDWLAVEFRDGGGSFKKLHRLILTSASYRQSSANRPEYTQRDADNRFLWRMNRLRLDAESVRDAVLAVSGKLDLTMGGPSVEQFVFKDDHSPLYDYARYDPDSPGAWRRSIYRFIVRSVPDPFLESLDCPDASTLTPKRNQTQTALQALAMWNDPFMVRQAKHLADRVRGSEPIGRAFLLALGRQPAPEEQRVLNSYRARHGLENACRLILNSNEFFFID